MKTTIKLAAIFLALLITVACSPDKPASEPEPDPIDNNDDGNGDDNGDDDGYVAGTGDGTYIAEFVENTTFDILYSYGHNFAAEQEDTGKYFVILSAQGSGYPGFGGLGYFAITLDGEKYISTQSDNTEYERLITELRDTTSPLEIDGVCDYPRPMGSILDVKYPSMVAITNSIKNFVITAEPQYTSVIASEEPINELFNLFYADMADFIWKGYERPEGSYAMWITFNPTRVQQQNTWQLWLDMPAYYINVPAEDKEAYCNVNYIGQDIILYPKTEPDNMEQEFVFTFKIEFTDGTIVTKTTEPTRIRKLPWD
jgi:hypothetical protein